MKGWILTTEERDYLALKPGEEALIIRKHAMAFIAKNTTVNAPIDLFGATSLALVATEGPWATNMNEANKIEQNIRVVFKAAQLVVIPQDTAVVDEAKLKAILEVTKALHYGFLVTYKVNQTDYGSSSSWTIPDGGGPTGALGNTTTGGVAKQDTGGWMSWGVQNPTNAEEINMQVPNGESFFVQLIPRKTGITIPNVVDFWIGMKLSGPGNRIVAQAGPTGAKPN
jgi:hypothetical protein